MWRSKLFWFVVLLFLVNMINICDGKGISSAKGGRSRGSRRGGRRRSGYYGGGGGNGKILNDSIDKFLSDVYCIAVD